MCVYVILASGAPFQIWGEKMGLDEKKGKGKRSIFAIAHFNKTGSCVFFVLTAHRIFFFFFCVWGRGGGGGS